ncbi:MAG TPA: ATP-binding cassette domain-containing protein, partial [Spirochaetota bacterium]|nr:ATP-binding cassette domain-containing protein [Spirochaetota bacterium]
MIVFDKVTKKYNDGKPVVDNISFSVAKKQTLVLLGKSGCGKTTTLKMINRLIEKNSGHIYLDQQDIDGVDPISLRKNIGYVIQHIGLFPHMNIRQNIAVVPKLKKWSQTKIDKKLTRTLQLVRLSPGLLERYPDELSG